MNKKKLLSMLVAMGLVAVVGIGGTLAWLTAETNEVVNTFAIGPGYTNEDGIVLDIRENLVWRNPDTGIFTKVDTQTTTDGEGMIGNGKTYVVYNTEEFTKNNDGSVTVNKPADATGGTAEGIEYIGIVPNSIIPKNPHVAIADTEEGVVNSRVYIRLEGIDKMEEVAAVTGFDVSSWVKVMDLESKDTNTASELDGYYLYVGSEATGADIDGDGSVRGVDEESVILTSDTVDGLVTEDLFTTITIDNLTEAELTEVAVDDKLHNVYASSAIIQSDNLTLDESNAEVFATLKAKLPR